MLRIFSSRAHWLIGVGLFIGISVSRNPDARAQDTNAASVAELQQRLQELEAVVKQMKDRDANASSTVTPTRMSTETPAAPPANPTADPPDPPVGGGATGAAENFIGWN
ncbi:MAG: hypothetical protein ABSG53_10500, partial [Thermoguttaceae bacterium]